LQKARRQARELRRAQKVMRASNAAILPRSNVIAVVLEIITHRQPINTSHWMALWDSPFQGYITCSWIQCARPTLHTIHQSVALLAERETLWISVRRLLTSIHDIRDRALATRFGFAVGQYSIECSGWQTCVVCWYTLEAIRTRHRARLVCANATAIVDNSISFWSVVDAHLCFAMR